MTTSNFVNKPAPFYLAAEAKWVDADNVLGGTATMRSAGVLYLPRNDEESTKHYDSRIERSFLYNVFGHTVKAMAGKPLQEPVGLEAPDSFLEYAKDINLQGQDLTSFVGELIEEALAKGITFILIDYPVAPQTKKGDKKARTSKGQENDAGIRPYWTHITPRNLIGFKSESVKGTQTLTEVRIRETIKKVDKNDKYKEIEIEQLRVIGTDYFEIWQKTAKSSSKNEEWELKESGSRSVHTVTVVPVYADKAGFMEGETPIAALLEKNLEHWQSASDQRNILHLARVPLLFGKMIEQEIDPQTSKPKGKMKTGSVILSHDPEADLKYVEISGDGAITAGQNDLNALTKEMETMGGQIMLASMVQQTATEDDNDESKTNSILHRVIANVESSLKQAFVYTELYTTSDGSDFVVSLYKEFLRATSDYVSFKDLLSAVSMKLISRASFYKICNQNNILVGENLVMADEVAMLEEEMALDALIPDPFVDDTDDDDEDDDDEE